MPPGTLHLAESLLDPAGPVRLVLAVFRQRPEFNLLVGNAGSIFEVPFLEMRPEPGEKTINLFGRAGHFVARTFARERFARQRPGAIVTTCPPNGLYPVDNTTAHDTAKGALVMLTRTLAQSLAPHHIRVSGIAPKSWAISLGHAFKKHP